MGKKEDNAEAIKKHLKMAEEARENAKRIEAAKKAEKDPKNNT